MIDLNLTRQQEEWLDRALADSHMIRVRIYRCDLDGNVRNPLSERLMGGQVNVDANAAVTRSATVDLFDPTHSIGFVPDSPDEADIFLDDMIRILYDVWVDQMNEWVEIPIFVGPISSVTRNGAVVTVECQGKETLAMGQAWKGKAFKKGRRRVEVLKDILREYAGENQFVMPELQKNKLKADMNITRDSVPWKVCKKLAKGLEDRQLFYDGRGRVRLRVPPEKPVFVFRDGHTATDKTPGPTVMTVPQVTFTSDGIVNAVYVKGGVEKTAPDKDDSKDDDKKADDKEKEEKPKSITAEAVAPRSHPLSPYNLGAGDSERYLGKTITNNSIRSKDEAMLLALRTLSRELLRGKEVAFDSLPIPYLEEGDMVRVNTEYFTDSFILNQFSIPLTAGELMSIGYNERMRRGRYRSRRQIKLNKRMNRKRRQEKRQSDKKERQEFQDYRKRIMGNDDLTDKQKQRKLEQYREKHDLG